MSLRHVQGSQLNALRAAHARPAVAPPAVLRPCVMVKAASGANGGAAAEQNASSSAAADGPAVFAPDKRLPPPPPEWLEAKRKQREADIQSQGGIRIRRRPPSGPKSHAMGAFEFLIDDDDNVPINILEEIVWSKDSEVDKMKEKMPLPLVRQALMASDIPHPRDFVAALQARATETGLPALIAEVKKASPSRGVIQPDFDPVRIAQAYEQGGAACLSVLTDSKYFQGSFENLRLIRNAGVQIPLLCKEFIIDAWQLYYARLHGADAVLLIAAVLPDQDLKYMLKIIHSLGMNALVEVHTEQEMERVLALEDIRLIGINNRDLGTFKVDIGNTEQLLAGERGQSIRDRGILVVGESGLFVPADIERVQQAGCSAVLVGESIVKQSDPAAGIAGLFGRSIARSSQAPAESKIPTAA